METEMTPDKNEWLSDQAWEPGGVALERAIALGRAIRERRGTDLVPSSETLLDMMRGERDAEIELLVG
jgi:hypothetical protein